MNEVWGEEVLKLPACRVVYGDKKQMLFHGPRVRMGVYEGVPTRVCPHTTTGRADYFGPLVNRYTSLICLGSDVPSTRDSQGVKRMRSACAL